MNETEIAIRVYYEDTDFSGVVYHANYLKFFERGRTEALRLTGVGHADLLALEKPLAFTARRVAVEFVKPARIDDMLRIVSKITEVKGARMQFEQKILCGDDVIATADVLVACITLDGKPTRMPKEILAHFD